MRDGLRPKVGLLYALQPGATEGLLITLGPLSLRGNARDLAELCCVGAAPLGADHVSLDRGQTAGEWCLQDGRASVGGSS